MKKTIVYYAVLTILLGACSGQDSHSGLIRPEKNSGNNISPGLAGNGHTHEGNSHRRIPEDPEITNGETLQGYYAGLTAIQSNLPDPRDRCLTRGNINQR